MPEHQDFHVLVNIASGEERQPAEQPDHEQIEEAKEHQCRGQKPRSDTLHEFWRATGVTRPAPGSATTGTANPIITGCSGSILVMFILSRRPGDKRNFVNFVTEGRCVTLRAAVTRDTR